MEHSVFAGQVCDFVARPCPERAAKLIESCRPFVIKQAAMWQNSGLSMFERIREILAEMFLILCEDVRPQQVKDAYSLLSYLNLKLRRLTRPRREKAFSFGLSNDMKDIGRSHFSPMRLQLSKEIVAAVRKTLAAQNEKQTGMLEMLFIHVFPEITWASRELSRKFGEVPETRHAADRRRHLVFNQKLRKEFNQLPSADWREIQSWSSGERSYLAGRIIDFVPADFYSCPEAEIEILEDWRRSFDKKTAAENEQLEAITRIFRSLQTFWNHSNSEKEKKAAEEAALYGEEFDLIAALIRPASESQPVVAEGSSQYQVQQGIKETGDSIVEAKFARSAEESLADKTNPDEEFARAAAEINVWLQKLLDSATFSSDRT